jgi:hypothetical protein
MTDQQKSFFAANWFKLFIVLTVVLAFLLYIERGLQLDQCLTRVDESYSKRWDEECVKSKLKAGCDLLIMGNQLNNMKDKQSDQCFRRYSFK